MSTVISFSKNYDINIEQRVYMMRIVFGKVLLKKKGEKIMTKRFGFTLAEVLITLGIIGVVAAMTMPTLMNQTNGAQYKAAYKKALSAISQGVTLNVALDDVSFADTVKGTAGATTAPTSGVSIASLLNTRMVIAKASNAANSGYGMSGEGDNAISKFPGKVSTKTCEEAGKNPGDAGCTLKTVDVTPDTFLFFNDGSMFAFKNDDAVGCTDDAVKGVNHCYGIIDVNGTKGPNTVTGCDDADATEANCVVTNPKDIYPVEFFDQTILPASPAAKAVLYGK